MLAGHLGLAGSLMSRRAFAQADKSNPFLEAGFAPEAIGVL